MNNVFESAHIIGVHWTDKYDCTFYVLFSDGTWEAYSVADGVHPHGIKAYLDLRVCTQKKMSKKQVDDYIHDKMNKLKEQADEMRKNGEL